VQQPLQLGAGVERALPGKLACELLGTEVFGLLYPLTDTIDWHRQAKRLNVYFVGWNY
jgi:hypothetical protein